MDVLPQLAESIDKKHLPEYLTDDRYCFEQKADGHRKLVWLRDGKVEPLNRQGKATDLPYEVMDELPRVSHGAIALDGEVIGDTFWIFDLPCAPGLVEMSDPYSFRRSVLDQLADGASLVSEHVRVLPSACTPEDKMALSRKVIEAGGEGLMVKDLEAPYLSGKRHKGLLKAKFVKDVDAVITRFGVGKSSNGSGLPKSNCELALYDDAGNLIPVAECIIHPKERNQTVTFEESLAWKTDDLHPNVTCVVTVAYLYCVDPEKPRLVQPTRIRPRFDKSAAECTLDQLRFTSKEIHIL